MVTTDILHNNYVLSEGQTSVTIPGGGQASVPLVLAPVVANVFLPTPTILAAVTDGGAAGSLETTVFLTDELGYVIPYFSGAPAPDNAPGGAFVTISPATSGLTFKSEGIATPATVTNTSLTALGGGALVATASEPSYVIPTDTGAATAGSYAGLLLPNILIPSAPFSLATNGAITVANGGQVDTVSAGNPINITCTTNSASVAWNAVITSNATGTVTGYSYTAANYPATTTTIPLTPINCTPGFSVPIE